MMPTLATVEELSDWLSEPIPEGSTDAKRAALCLRLASALVRKESGRTWLNEQGGLIEPLPDDVTMVTLYCASRVYDNREAQTRGGLDDYQEGWKVDEAGAYLTASEKGLLSVFAQSATPGLGTVATTRRSGPYTATGWVPTDTPGVFFPWY